MQTRSVLPSGGQIRRSRIRGACEPASPVFQPGTGRPSTNEKDRGGWPTVLGYEACVLGGEIFAVVLPTASNGLRRFSDHRRDCRSSEGRCHAFRPVMEAYRSHASQGVGIFLATVGQQIVNDNGVVGPSSRSPVFGIQDTFV